MRRRILAVLLAGVLAGGGAFVLVSYVRDADARAQAGEEQVQVLVVDEAVPAGTGTDQLANRISLVDVPARLAAPDSLSDLSGLAGQVSTAALLPGEQVLSTRFTAPTPTLEELQQVSVTLDPQRAVGGVLQPGNRVAVYDTGEAGRLLHADVLVSQVIGGAPATGPVTVTLELEADQVQSVVAGMATNSIWLALHTGPAPADNLVTTSSTSGDDQ